MRNTFSDELVRYTSTDSRVYLLTGDHGYALFDALRKANPDRYINAGVAEQNMVGVAAGMAKAGLIPIVYGLSSFVPIRVLEQIKLDVCFENLRVIFIGDGAGVVYSTLGVSHQCFEDIAALRALPNMKILSPCDKQEMKICLEEAMNYNGPSYIRVGKCDVGNIHQDSSKVLKPGIHEIKKGSPGSPVILATGSMVKTAQDIIENTFKDFGLCSVSMIKPLSTQELMIFTGSANLVITLEEHSVFGGMGSAISEVISSSTPKRVVRLGIEDKFSDKCGTYEYLMQEHELNREGVIMKIKRALA